MDSKFFNLLLLLIFLFTAGISNQTKADFNSLTEPLASNTLSQLYLCDTDITSMASRCDDLSEQALQRRAEFLIGPPFNPECEQNPQDPSCSGSADNAYAAVEFFIIFARAGTAQRWRIEKQIGTYHVRSLSTAGKIDEVAGKFKQLNQTYVLMGKKYNFTQQNDGGFSNKLGESFYNGHDFIESDNESEFLKGTTVKGLLLNDGDCKSAIAYLYSNNCISFINGWIRQEVLMGQFKEFQRIHANLREQLSSLSMQSRATADAVHLIPMHFLDDSILVLAIGTSRDKNLPPKINVEMHRSRASNQFTLEQFKEARLGVNGLMLSESEAYVYMTGGGCKSPVPLTNSKKTYLVTTVMPAEGSSEVTAVELSGRQPIWDKAVSCQGRY
ncbi:hypothetical protein [Bowmanella denitrificans]|uniref:hypothetical protein n=1 Tax=Bowmanella denitrificans TaxID=366582 RepID=UPI000C9CA1AC|nr:hypothetical protein [Bowmanella denitrificans]